MNYSFRWLALILVVSSLVNFSCTRQDNINEIQTLDIHVEDFKSSGNLSDLLDLTEVIPLETTPNSLINNIDKVKVHGQNIFVFDRMTQRLLNFDLNGNFLGQYGKRGKGPGEYLEMMDFELDTIRSLVYVLDFKKIHVFSISGEHEKTIETEFFGSKLYFHENGECVFYGAGRNDRLLMADSLFNLKKSFFPYTLAHRIDPNFWYSKYQDNTIFHLPKCDTLYAIKFGQFKANLHLDFNGKNFTESDFNNLPENDKANLHDYILKGGKYVSCSEFIPINNQAFILVLYSNAAYCGVYNFETDYYAFVNFKNVKNDVFGSFVYLNPKGTTEDELIFSVQADRFDKTKSNSFYLKHFDKLNQIDENSNPVLLLAKMKI